MINIKYYIVMIEADDTGPLGAELAQVEAKDVEESLVIWFRDYYFKDVLQTGTLKEWEKNMTAIEGRDILASSFRDVKEYIDSWDASGLVIFDEEFKQVFATGNDGGIR